MKIALLGVGTVGSGVREQLAGDSRFEIKRILVRREIPELGALATFSFDDILRDDEIEAVVEVIGGEQPALDYVLRSLRAGKHVVTANKLMLSENMEALAEAAHAGRARLMIDASVGGGIPYLHNLARAGRRGGIQSVFGIVNGTTNLILDTMQSEGADFADVLAQAQRAGYAEADPTADIDGLDARAKLCVAAAAGFGCAVRPAEVDTAGIRTLSLGDVRVFRQLGRVCRLIARMDRPENGNAPAYVEPTLVGSMDILAAIRRNDNLIGYVERNAGLQYFFGQGAGKSPTAFNVIMGLEDLLEGRPGALERLAGSVSVDNGRLAHRYYLRTAARLEIEAQALADVGEARAYLTAPLSVSHMHALVRKLRKADPNLFFAGLRD